MRMGSTVIALAALFATLASAGCHRADSQRSLAGRVASTRHEVAQQEVAALQREARTNAEADADEAAVVQRDEARKAGSAYEVAVTEAEGRHKIAVVQCAALAGDAQRDCRVQADAALSLAKADAEAARSASGG